MSILPTYQNGTLPDPRRNTRWASVRVLRCDYWLLQVWNHANLAAPYWRLYWNGENGAEVVLGNARYALGPECMVLIPPQTPFTTRFNGVGVAVPTDNVMTGCPVAEWRETAGRGNVVHHLFVHFLVGAPGERVAPRIITLPVDEQSRQQIALLLPELSVDSEGWGRAAAYALHALLYGALARLPAALWPAAPADPRVQRVLRAIEEDYAKPFTNEDFGELVSMHPKALVRLFKTQLQLTPQAYLLRIRMEQASILLHHGDESIEVIAERSGCCDRHHFSKLFKRVYGIGPASYRRLRMP